MNISDVKYIVIHCSDTPNEREHTAADIHRWHKEMGWDGIGYHFVIGRGGAVEYGRPIYWPGAHVRGHNHESIGVCLVGRDEFKQPQLSSLKSLVKALRNKFNRARVVGHRELDSAKTCPNFNVQEWLTAVESLNEDF
ncbi:N-acetylmuramoyl-L-alanine amidase [Gayadomonas joobiniege]|uniref:N-acetylmuramoyl-L-alanine amidase n=1 Tax=Gayadomonas joobiniege TaxID=1234606 RepID=UPI00035DFCB4|nr:N-acetylmuramoyl-L-alanine amidase [Gayadomonas joobiniege]